MNHKSLPKYYTCYLIMTKNQIILLNLLNCLYRLIIDQIVNSLKIKLNNMDFTITLGSKESIHIV